MFHRLKKDYTNWVIVIGGFILLLEVFVFNPGLIFSFLVSIGMMYFAKQSKWKIRKVIFWIGFFILLMSVLHMVTVKFILVSIVFYYFIQLVQKKKDIEVIKPIILDKNETETKEDLYKKKPMFQNTFFQRNETPDHVYEWNDVNIQVGVADTIIDLSYTVLPKGETVIFIRNLIGNVKVHVPYDMDVSINHSVLFGSYDIFGEQENNVLNRNTQLRNAAFDLAETRVKIFTSCIVGSLEVKRI
ncbi:cell wall-active antibiotics response protein LiaF [Niallia sp. 01092]|uniref:cell wall-active antibiotics response protein LiaF n=1 Tax=unclassified Niallia TaxID=2837522 RepID=UPI003FD010AD